MKNKSRLISVLRFSVIIILLLVVFAVIMQCVFPDLEMLNLYTTAITGIITLTAALIARYGVRESVMSSKLDSKSANEFITKAVENDKT